MRICCGGGVFDEAVTAGYGGAVPAGGGGFGHKSHI